MQQLPPATGQPSNYAINGIHENNKNMYLAVIVTADAANKNIQQLSFGTDDALFNNEQLQETATVLKVLVTHNNRIAVPSRTADNYMNPRYDAFQSSGMD